MSHDLLESSPLFDGDLPRHAEEQHWYLRSMII